MLCRLCIPQAPSANAVFGKEFHRPDDTVFVLNSVATSFSDIILFSIYSFHKIFFFALLFALLVAVDY